MPERTKAARERDGSALDLLAHPVFLAALVLLVVNDHLLKGNLGGVPWLTGKLSDFAGLLVAPITLAALFGARSRSARALSIAAPTALFVALQLSPSVAALYDGALRSLGLSSRTVSDPTDLIALSMVPVAWHILASSHRGDANAWLRSWRRPATHALLGASLFACIATSREPGPLPGSGFFMTTAAVVNLTGSAIDVRMRWAEVDLDCDAIEPTELSRLVPRSAFGEGVTFHLEPDQTAPLEQAAALASVSGALPMGTAATCELALVSVDGVPETIVLWQSTMRGSVPDAVEVIEETGVPTVAIVTSGGRPTVETQRALARELVDPPPAAPMCGPWGEPLVHSELGSLEGELEIQEASTTVDDCLSLVVARFAPGTLPEDPPELGSPQRVFLCGLSDLWLFDPGDHVRLSISRTSVRFDGIDDDRAVVLFESAERAAEGPFDIRVRAGSADCWRRDACGAYLHAAELVETDFVRLEPSLEVGTVSETIDETTGRRARVLVTRADTVVSGLAGCDSARDAAQTVMDVVIALDATPLETDPTPAGEMP